MAEKCAFWNEYDSVAGHICYCELAAFNRPVNPNFLSAIGCSPEKRVECMKSMEYAVGKGVVPKELAPPVTTTAAPVKKGIFEQANKATLFLEEIDSASPAIQIKLLRVLETGEFLRVGGEEMCKVDARIITATNARLAEKVAENKFREDLFYRLDVASFHIPPLRERTEDLELFINYFLDKESVAKQIPIKTGFLKHTG
jgi:hypothetical protein